MAAIALFIKLPAGLPPQRSRESGRGVQGVTVGGNFNLWEAENPFDIYLLIVILVACTAGLGF